MEKEAIRLFIVDDHEIVRLGVHRALESEDDVVLVGEAASGREALRKVKEVKPDVVLVDVKLPDISGIELVKKLREDPGTAGVRPIVLTILDDLEIAVEAIKAGAMGYVLKDCGKDMLLGVIRSAHQGELVVPPILYDRVIRILQEEMPGAAQDARRRLPFNLTERENEVLRLVTNGYSNKDIASELGISMSTVKVHLRNIYRKLEVEDRAQAIIKAIKEGIVG